MPCHAITQGGTRCTRNKTETVFLDDETMEICRPHRTLLEEYLDTFGMDTAIQRIRHGRASIMEPLIWPSGDAISTNSTCGSFRAGSR